LITTCSIAIPVPIVKRENKKMPNVGLEAKNKDATIASIKPNTIIFFSPNFSSIKPAGIDITPYAIKKENGKNPAIVALRSKLDETLGFKAPRILVKNEITKKVKRISNTII
jgi:hypothetical protein